MHCSKQLAFGSRVSKVVDIKKPVYAYNYFAMEMRKLRIASGEAALVRDL